MKKPFREFIINKERRKSDRRRMVDPRYKNPLYPEFVERRSERDRRCQGDCLKRSIFSEHGSSGKMAVVLGTTVALVGFYLFVLGIYHLRIVCD